MRTNKLNFLRALSLTTIMLLVLGIAACSDESAPTGNINSDELNGSLDKGRVIHHVSVGGADICEAIGEPTGCDANFSLTAIMKADGSVKGQWQDTFSGGGNGIHVAIDCMIIDGNTAIVGGVITHGSSNGNDLAGLRAVTKVVDNGTSQKDDADLISFSYFTEGNCDDLSEFNFVLLELAKGQVKVK